MRLRHAALFLLLIAPAFGQDVTIKGETKVPAGRLVRLTLDGKFDTALWDAAPAELADGAETDPAGHGYVFTGPPGKYSVFATAIDFTAKTARKYRVVVEITGTPAPPTPVPVPPTPVPVPPEPTPTPPPTPNPVVTGKLWVRLIYNPDDPASTDLLRGSATLQATLANLNADWTVWRHTDPIIATKRLDSYLAATGGPPCLIVQGPDGKVLSNAKAPASPDDVVALCRKLRGVP